MLICQQSYLILFRVQCESWLLFLFTGVICAGCALIYPMMMRLHYCKSFLLGISMGHVQLVHSIAASLTIAVMFRLIFLPYYDCLRCDILGQNPHVL